MRGRLLIIALVVSQALMSQPFHRVRAFLAEDRTREAAVIVDSCLIARYQRDSALYYSGMVNLKYHNITAARNDYRTLSKEFPDFYDAHYLHGLIYYADEDYGKSIDEFNKTIKAHPDHVRAYYNRSLALGMTENYLLAVEDLDKCLEINPSFAHAYYSRAYWKEFLGKYSEAAADYEADIRLEPRRYDSYFGLAWCQQKQNQPDKACETIQRAITEGSQIAEELKEQFCK
jgi:tetratricopeptide (TPR) repeat protein